MNKEEKASAIICLFGSYLLAGICLLTTSYFIKFIVGCAGIIVSVRIYYLFFSDINKRVSLQMNERNFWIAGVFMFQPLLIFYFTRIGFKKRDHDTGVCP